MFNLVRKVPWACSDDAYNKFIMIGISRAKRIRDRYQVILAHAIYETILIHNVHLVS